MKKKKLIGLTVVAAAMTAMMSFAAFAGWEQDTNGWKYIHDNGSQQWAGWFTDPADGSIYYIDPDGYMMTETRVSGYWLGADGRRVEKTQEEIDREAARAEREASRPAPSQPSAAAAAAAQAANTGTASTTTTRRAYVAEMEVFMERYYLETVRSLVNTHENFIPDTSVNNTERTYRFTMRDQGNIISTSLWPVALETSAGYQPQAADISYSRAVLGEDEEINKFDNLFRNMVIAALGNTTGQQVYDNMFAQLGNGVSEFEYDGNTDSGNYYTVSCGNGTVNIRITCSENTGAESTEAATDTSNNEAAAENTEAAAEAPASSVITVGGGSTADTTEDTADDTYVPEDENAE